MQTSGNGLDIRLLGDFSVATGGRSVTAWPSLRAAQLVQLLSLAPRHRLLRDQVVDALWPQLDASAGGANLRKAAHHARQALGDRSAIVLKNGEVALAPLAPISVDAVEFEERAAAALARRHPAECAEVARGYRGDLLPASAYEPWADDARRRLRQRYLELLRAAGAWEQLAEADPLDEPAHRELMRRELDAGNRAAAIRWYARLRHALRHTLGLSPDAETEAMYRRCLERARIPAPEFVGRRLELAQVEAWLAAPVSEREGGTVIRGPAGIGKTAILRQVERLCSERECAMVRVDAEPSGRAYGVVAAVVDRILMADRSLAQAIGEPARRVLAELSTLAGAASPLQMPVGRHQVIGAFRRLLLAAANGRPFVLAVDDAHLADDGDADVLLNLTVTGRPVAVLLALRPHPTAFSLSRGVSRLVRNRQLQAIDLGPLDEFDATTLVTQAATAQLDKPAIDRIVRLAAGHPFAAIELARSAEGIRGAHLPENCRDAILACLCDVDATASALLQRLAVTGDDFDPATVLALANAPEATAFAALDRALTAGVLVVSDGRYRFRHELVRQVLVDQTPPHQHIEIHRQAALRLADLHAPPATIARHWLAASLPGEAAPWCLQSARDAIRLGAFRDVLKHLEPVLLGDRAHAEALRLRAEALDALGDPLAVSAYRQAADAADDGTADDLRAKGALAQIKQGDPKGALEALEHLSPRTPDGRLSEALAYCGAAALGVTGPERGTRKAAEARRLALETADASALVVASWAQAAAAHARGELHGSLWADLYDTQHVPHLAVRVFDGQLCIAQRFLYGGRPYPEVIAFTTALADQAQRLGAPRGHAFGVTLRGEAELLAGDLDAAETHLTLGVRLHHAIGAATGEAFALQRLAELALYRGERALAAARLDEALDLARQTDIGFHLLDRIYGTRMAMAIEPDAALAALEDAQQAVRGPLETCPGCRITFAVPAAIAAARACRLDLAEAHHHAVEYLASVVMRLPAWYAALEEVRAHLARARGDAAEARARFASAARLFGDAGQPLDAARCHSER